jgi:hypothetical protein
MAQITYSLYNPATIEGDQKLAVEIAENYLALVLGNASSVAGFEYYDGEENDLEELLNYAKNNSRILGKTYSEARLYYNLEEAVLVPVGQFNTSVASELVDLAFGRVTSYRINVENINVVPGIVNVYRSSEDWQGIIGQYFRAVTKRHLYSKLVEESIAGNKELKLVLYKDSFTIVAAKDQQLKLVRSFGYNADADVLYHILNACMQAGIVAAEIPVNVSGFIDEQSSLFNLLGKYFGVLVIDNIHQGPPDQQDQYPSHYFTHFFNLLS